MSKRSAEDDSLASTDQVDGSLNKRRRTHHHYVHHKQNLSPDDLLPEEQVQSLLTRSLTLALVAADFKGADPVALEKFRVAVDERTLTQRQYIALADHCSRYPPSALSRHSINALLPSNDSNPPGLCRGSSSRADLLDELTASSATITAAFNMSTAASPSFARQRSRSPSVAFVGSGVEREIRERSALIYSSEFPILS